jgi:hypothetical protein
MLAKLNFWVATGVFRFERQRMNTKATLLNQDKNNKRKREDDSGSEDEPDP